MLPDKSPLKSLTIWGLAIFAAAAAGCAALSCGAVGAACPAWLVTACALVEKGGAILALFGLRRAVGTTAVEIAGPSSGPPPVGSVVNRP